MYNIISKNSEDFIYLLTCAVNGEVPDKTRCEQIDLDKLYKLASFHSLLSMTSFVLGQVIKLPENYFQAEKQAIRNQALYNIERSKILSEFEKNGIWYMPLKGIVLKDLYPKSSLREMVDNDILCDGSKMAEVKKIMESRGYYCKYYGKSHHDVYTKQPYLAFEMHSALFNEKKEKLYFSYYKNVREKLVKDENNSFGYHFTNEDFYIFLLCHFRMHYDMAGTGLRSLLDVYVFNKKYYDSLNLDYLSAELEKLKLKDFEQNVRSLSNKLYNGEKLNEDEQKSVEYYLSSGSRGTNINLIYSKLNFDDSKKAKRKYLFRRVFPSYDKLKEKNQALEKHKILYPAFLVFRPVKGVFSHPKKILREFKIIKNYKNEENGGKNA